MTSEGGIAYESIRLGGTPRLLLMLCAVKPADMEMFSKVFNLTESGERRDRLNFSLAEFAAQTLRDNCIAYEDAVDTTGKRTALAFCVVRPDVLRAIEKAFQLPP